MTRPTRTSTVSNDPSEGETNEGAQNARKKRRRCGACEPCLTKINCDTCSNCLNRRTGHQICKFRKCIELRKKTTEVAVSPESSPTTRQRETANERESNQITTKSDSIAETITVNTRDETGPKGQSASPECQRQKRASKNRKTSSKGEKKAKNSEKKARKREEEILRAQKAAEGETQGQSKQEIQNSSPIENTQASEVTDCHPAQQTNASTESLKAGPVPLSSDPEQWCSCKVKDEGSVYKHLGVGPSVAHVRSILAKRFNLSPESVRIEKVAHSEKEGKNRDGCPIAKWVLRRESTEEKILGVVRQRPGHTCDFAFIIISIVLWDGIPSEQADSLYTDLTSTLNEHAIPTSRKCATNKGKQCACQGSDPTTAGASFSFGCSWSRYLNRCKFARSKTPRKFKLLDQEKEDSIDNLLQDLATQVAQTYKTLAPEAFENQTCHDTEGVECRIGSNEENTRPFSGITCCVDFCAHNHKDDHNMDNGATVVLTLLGKDARKNTNCEEDEQIHSLPLYHLLDNNDNVVPPNYAIPEHLLSSPMAPSPLKEVASSQGAENSDFVELFNGNRTFCTPQFSEGQNAGNINPRVPNPVLVSNFEYRNSNADMSKVPNSGITNNVSGELRKELFPGDNVPRGLENDLLNKPVNGYHNALQKPQHSSDFAPNYSITSNGYNRDFLRPKFPGDIYPRVQNSEVLNGRVNGYHDLQETNPGLREGNPGNSAQDQERILNGSHVKQTEAYDFLTKFMNGKNRPGFVNGLGNVTHGYNDIPLYPGFIMNGFHSNGLPKNGYHPNALVRQESSESRGNSVPSEKCDLDRENSENNSRNENNSTNDDVRWIDSSMGGVGLALSHGSILIECAKQEVHATTRIKNPNRKDPTRISIVFYQHRLMNFKNHGFEEYRKYQEQKKAASEKAASNADGELSYDAFDLRMLAETAVNYPSPAEQAMADRNVANYPGGIPSQVNGTLDSYLHPLHPLLVNKHGNPASVVNGKIDNYARPVALATKTTGSYSERSSNQISGKNHVIQTNGESTSSMTTQSIPRSMQYPQTNGISKSHLNGSVLNNHHASFPISEYLRSLKHSTNFPLPYPTFPFANTLPLTPFIPPIFLPPPRHPSAMFNPFTPAGRGSYHVLNSQHQTGPPIHEINRTSQYKLSQNTYQNLPTRESSLNAHQRLPTHQLKNSSDPKPSQNTNPSIHEIKSNSDPKSNTNDYSVEALLGRKRAHSHGEISSNNMTENHPLKQRRLDQNGLSYLSSIFNKQPDIHTRVLGLPLHPDLPVDRTKFAPYDFPYPAKTIFTGTTTYATDSLVNMAPFAGTLVGGGHYQW
ncbi:Methylcytosine dioxygenase TET2 [Paramuricea clavata]|uniref:Methylcytosine dioxygenase TET n=1 Tax=Paramuricea clavata TaxID=317549 RepID=A0A6S7HMQ3_PARCT|nr:Methylcytosine dioxygenase TET2 [Paramuricea clavata]